jgi:hypothetical protein
MSMFASIEKALSDESPFIRLTASHTIVQCRDVDGDAKLAIAIDREQDETIRTEMSADILTLRNLKDAQAR